MPGAEVDITVDLVRELLRDQAPSLANDEIVLVAAGWDNVLFRLGTDHVVRLPRRQLAAELIETEQRWLPSLARSLPLPIPAPVFAGVPGRGYPWSWSVCPWFDGESALRTPPRELERAADTMASFVNALHSIPTPDDPPTNPYRGIPLRARDEVTRNAIAQISRPELISPWEDALALPEWTAAPVWLHGDLHPGNVVVDRGAISAVVDFGDICVGDPATDLFIAWAMFPAAIREVFRGALDVDDDTWARGRAWALAWGGVVTANSADNPPYRALGERMLAAVSADLAS